MDAHDLFRQLTRGVKFTKRSKPAAKVRNEQKHPINKIFNQQFASFKNKQQQLVEKESKLEEDLKIKDEGIATDEDESMAEHDETQKDINGDSEEEVVEEMEDEPQTFEFISGVTTTSKKSKKKSKQLTSKQQEQQLEDEMIQTIRKENRIAVLGKNIPAPISTFEELHTNYGMSERMVENLVNCNYAKPTAIQMQAIPIMLKGRPLMACAPTGSGKTIAFLAPIINDLKSPKKVGFRAMVLAPTRELAQQIYRECIRLSEKTALKVHIISKVNQAKQKFGENSSKKFDILISTPNRVRFLLQQEPPVLDLKR